MPTIVSALAFYRIFVDLRLLDSLPGVILAHAVLSVPYVVITVSTSLANFDLRLEQAARNLGASLGQTLRYVILPCIAPGVLSGAVFAFIQSWDEIVVTLFITSLKVFTLPRRMWDGIREQADPMADDYQTVTCYEKIIERIRQMAAAGHVRLAETVAHKVALMCLAEPLAEEVTVRVEKLDAVHDAASVGVEIRRFRRNSAEDSSSPRLRITGKR